MAVRPPASLKRPKLGDNPLAAALDQEILAEMAATYGRLMQALEKALAALRAFDEGDGAGSQDFRAQRGKRDRAQGESPPTRSREGEARTDVSASEARDELVAAAGEALWHVVIQRDVMRLSGTKQFLKEMKLPPEVMLAMGVKRGQASPDDRAFGATYRPSVPHAGKRGTKKPWHV